MDVSDINNSKLSNLKDNIRIFENINKKIGKNYLCKSVFYDQIKGDTIKIVSILLYNETVIPIKHEFYTEKDIKKLGLSVRFQPQEEDINKQISKTDVEIDDRSYRIKNRIYKTEAYNIFRLELYVF